MRGHVQVDSFEALRSDPLRWVLRELATYFAVLVPLALAIVIGAGVYTLISPASETPSIPLRKPPAILSPIEKPVPPSAEALVAVHSGKEIGVPILLGDSFYGVVTAIKKDAQGNNRVVVIQPIAQTATDARMASAAIPPAQTIEVPYEAVTWHSEEQGKVELQSGYDRVQGSLRRLWGDLIDDSHVGEDKP